MNTDQLRDVADLAVPEPECPHVAVIHLMTGEPARLRCKLRANPGHTDHVGNVRAQDVGTPAGDTWVTVQFHWSTS